MYTGEAKTAQLYLIVHIFKMPKPVAQFLANCNAVFLNVSINYTPSFIRWTNWFRRFEDGGNQKQLPRFLPTL